MNNEQIADRFRKFADLLEIRGEEYYRIRSYRNASDVIENWSSSVARIAKEEGVKGLQTIPGVGKAISGKIMELVATGTFEAWETRVIETPITVLELMKIKGIGIKTASNLYRRFRIKSLLDLRDFVEGGGLELVDGMGEGNAARIAAQIARL